MVVVTSRCHCFTENEAWFLWSCRYFHDLYIKESTCLWHIWLFDNTAVLQLCICFLAPLMSLQIVLQSHSSVSTLFRIEHNLFGYHLEIPDQEVYIRVPVVHSLVFIWSSFCIFILILLYPWMNEFNSHKPNTVKPAHAVTSIKQSPVLKGHLFLVLW
jgi:hypothetical protein